MFVVLSLVISGTTHYAHAQGVRRYRFARKRLLEVTTALAEAELGVARVMIGKDSKLPRLSRE